MGLRQKHAVDHTKATSLITSVEDVSPTGRSHFEDTEEEITDSDMLFE